MYWDEERGIELNTGDSVIITSGKFAGMVGTIDGFTMEEGELLVLVDLANQETGAAVLPQQVELIDDSAVVDILKLGMTPDQLAAAVHGVMLFCMSRVKGPGQEQYSNGSIQKFEVMDLEELIEYQLEEIADDINYAIFRFIRLRRIQEAMKKHL